LHEIRFENPATPAKGTTCFRSFSLGNDLFTTVFTAQMGRGKIQWGAFTIVDGAGTIDTAGTTGSRDHRETPLRRQLVRVQNYYKKKDSVIFLNASNDTEKERYREEHGPFARMTRKNREWYRHSPHCAGSSSGCNPR